MLSAPEPPVMLSAEAPPVIEKPSVWPDKMMTTPAEASAALTASTEVMREFVAPAVLRSSDVAVSVILSVPSPPSTISRPTNPMMVSSPDPAMMLSAPEAPVSESAPAPPVIEKPSDCAASVMVTPAVALAAEMASTNVMRESVAAAVLRSSDVPVRMIVSAVPTPPLTVSAPRNP